MIFDFALGVFLIMATMAFLTFVAESDFVGKILAFLETDGDYRE